MKQIVITLTVPDGVGVTVNQGNGGSRDDKPFVERPAPPQPAGYCPVHEVNWKLVPAGTSTKTGKRYNAFWTCPERGCDERPPRDAAPAEEGLVDLPF